MAHKLPFKSACMVQPEDHIEVEEFEVGDKRGICIDVYADGGGVVLSHEDARRLALAILFVTANKVRSKPA